MKKLIIVIMALITIFSASVSAFALSSEEWAIVDYISNISHDGYNCSLVCKNTNAPTPSMTNLLGYAGTQKTSFNLMVSMYETVTSQGAHFINNTLMQGVFHWYEYGGYCWILFDPDGSTGNYWVGNKQGKILYCDAPDTGDTYTISAIAGVGSYYLTDRPIGTAGNGYGGDLYVQYDNWMNIKSLLTDVGGQYSYYPFIYSVDGEMRYYIASLIGGQKYFICNRAGQLYYTVKEEPSSGGSGDGSTFDDSEIIAALNSVYDALDYGFYDVCDWLDAIQDNITSLNKDVQVLSQSVTSGFFDLKDIGTDIFTKLVGIETLLDVRLSSIEDELWYIHGATAGLNSSFYDFAQVWEYKSEVFKELINGVEPNLISIASNMTSALTYIDGIEDSLTVIKGVVDGVEPNLINIASNIQTYLPRFDASIDEVESKLTSLESTITSQHETIVDYWDALQLGLFQWGDMELYALYGISPVFGNEYPDSYLKKIYDVLNETFLFDLDAGEVGRYYQLWLMYVDSFDYFVAWIERQLISQSGYLDGLEATLSNIYDRLEDIEDAVVSADNVIIDITTDNDAFNIFYITKTDGTTESVGDAAKDAAKVVGEFLSIFYRLVFDDALSNADIIHDFEDVYTVNDSGVSVW